MKRVFSTIAVASFAIASFAGGLLTNTNQSASFVRNPARYASLDADAVYFNPAGTAFLKEGWTVSANWQMIRQDRDVYSYAPISEHKGSVFVPIMPTFFGTYKTGDWAFSAFFGMPGGGGNAKFDNGLAMFNTMGDELLKGFAVPLKASSVFESTQYLFSLQLGAAYQITDNLSAYGGIRANYTSLSYEGSISAKAIGLDILALELTQTGLAFAPIVGIDYKVGDFNFGVKYEFRAVNTIKNDTKNLSSAALGWKMPQIGSNLDGKLGLLAAQMPKLAALASLQDGEKFRNDAPALLSIGASWDITDRVKVMGAGTYYFDKDAKIESLLGKSNTMKALSRNTFELLAGVEFKATEKLLLSSGIQFSDYGVNESYISQISFINDAFMIGAGGKYSINEKWDLNFGACYANYAHFTDESARYRRTTLNVAVGVDFRF